MVLGVLCAVFGILGALSGFCGALSSIGQFFLSGMMQGSAVGSETAEAMKRMAPYMFVGGIVNTGLAILLAAGGFGLAARRPWSRTVLLHWSWLKMLGVVLGVVLAFVMQQAMTQAAAESAASSGQAIPGGFRMMMGLFGGLGLVFSLIWGWALPVFNLIWFNRRAIRNEVQSWS